MPSRDHHFIPQSHLRRFAVDGKIVVYEKRSGQPPRFKAPRGQAFQTHLYTFTVEGGLLESKIEDEILQNIDSNGAAELSHLHSTAQPRSMTNLALYVASLIVRNPKAIEINRQQGSAVVRQMYPRMLRDPEIQSNIRRSCESDEEFKRMMKAAKTAYVEMHRDFSMTTQISLHPPVAEKLLKCDWQLLIADGVEEFLIADSPAFTCDPWSNKKSVAALGRPRNETTVPISAQMCLLLVGSGNGLFSRRFVPDEVVNEINRRSAYAAHQKFFASRVQQSWKELVLEFPQKEIAADIVQFDDGLIVLQMIENQHFRPLA